MAYCLNTDIAAVVPDAVLAQLTDDSAGTTTDLVKIDREIDCAGEIIDGYLRNRYELPLASIPGIIKYLSIDITVYRLYVRRLETSAVPESTALKYNEAVKMLEKISAGVISIGVEGMEAYGDLSMNTNKSASDREFNSSKWDTYWSI